MTVMDEPVYEKPAYTKKVGNFFVLPFLGVLGCTGKRYNLCSNIGDAGKFGEVYSMCCSLTEKCRKM
jgi:hypothetical protein